MSAHDIIELPGRPGMSGRRILVDAWVAAGSPPVNHKGAGRLYADQKYFWDGWVNRLPGFKPVDNPDDALATAAKHGCFPLRGVANYEGIYKLSYVRGPSGIIVMFAQDLRKNPES